MNTTNPIDDAAQAQDDHESLVEATTDRQILAEMEANVPFCVERKTNAKD